MFSKILSWTKALQPNLLFPSLGFPQWLESYYKRCKWNRHLVYVYFKHKRYWPHEWKQWKIDLSSIFRLIESHLQPSLKSMKWVQKWGCLPQPSSPTTLLQLSKVNTTNYLQNSFPICSCSLTMQYTQILEPKSITKLPLSFTLHALPSLLCFSARQRCTC